MHLDSPLTELKGIGGASYKKFNSLGLFTVYDLISYFPRRYEDYSLIVPISKLKPGKVSIKVSIKNARPRYSRRGLHITEAIASDETGSVKLIWFNQPYRAASLKPDQSYYVSGNFDLSAGRLSIVNPSVELATDMPVNSARILAIYRETKGLDSRQIRKASSQIFTGGLSIKETLPAWLIKQNGLISRESALTGIHLPKTTEDLAQAKHRLGFEEIFSLTLASLLNKLENKSAKSVSIKFKEDLAKQFVANLSFKLTDSQRITIWKIYKDLAKNEPMNRLVEGDVGSGKTVVAAMAALMVIAENKQVAYMAPTEILARQHAKTFYELLKPLKQEHLVCLIVGSMTTDQKNKAMASIKKGHAKIIIGTHTLIQSKVDMHDLALVIIDEQHRFGVEQRKKLMSKAGHMPHVLSLSATPIPRSLALTLYGELDISLLKQMPKARKPIKTKIVNVASKNTLLAQIDKEINSGRQVFIVCPSITGGGQLDISSVDEVYLEINKTILKKHKIGKLHGKLKSIDKNKIMNDFLNRKLDIIITTTVIEVGVDIPNASIMVVYNPERFGLAQLHQLRGRVGRGSQQGYFYMLTDSENQALPRLHALERSSDGFALAELDLDLRGPGAIYGTMQHGVIDLRVANLSDQDLIKQAIKASKEFVDRQEDLLKYKGLAQNVNKLRAVTNLN